MKIAFLWNAISILIAKSGMFLLTIIAFLLLDSDLFAQYGVMILLYSTFVGVFSQAVLMTANKYVSQQVCMRHFRQAIALGTLLLVVIIAFITNLHYGFNVLSSILLSVGMYIHVMFSFNIGILYGADHDRTQSKLYAIQVSTLILFGSVAMYFASIEGISFAIAASVTLGYLASLRYNIEVGIRQESLKHILKSVTIPVIFSGMSFSLVFLLLIELIKLGENYIEDMALFTVANQLRMVVATIPILFGNVLLRSLIKDADSIKMNYINYYISIIPTLFLVFAIDLAWHYWPLFNNVVYSKMYFISMLFLAGTAITAFKSGIGRNILAAGRGKLSVYSNLTWSLLFISMSYFGYYYGFGLNSIAVSFVLSQAIHYIFWRGTFIRYDVLKIREDDQLITLFFVSLVLFILQVYSEANVFFTWGLLAVFVCVTTIHIRKNYAI